MLWWYNKIMGLNAISGVEARPYAKQVEATWDPLFAARADRGPAVRTTVLIEDGVGKPAARMNLYSPMVMLGDPTHSTFETIAYTTDRSTAFSAGCKIAEEIISLIPPWAVRLVYLGDVIVLQEDNRNMGLGTTLLSKAFHSYIDEVTVPIPQVAVGTTENPAMLKVIEKLGGNKTTEWRRMELTNVFNPEDFGYKNYLQYTTEGQLTRYEPKRTALVFLDVGLIQNGRYELGFTLIFHGSVNRAIAVALPERRMTQLVSRTVYSTRLLGQMILFLNPDLPNSDLIRLEDDLASFLITHRWCNVLQQSSGEFHGSYLKTSEAVTVFEFPVN